MDPYLGQPNYMGAMSTGLSARLAYLNRKRGGGVRVSGSGSGSGSGNSMADKSAAGAPFSPERRAEYRNMMQEEEARRVAIEQAETGVAKTEADIAETKKRTEQIGFIPEVGAEGKRLSNKMLKAKIKKSETDQMTTVLGDIKKWIPMATQDTISDLFDRAAETGVVSRSMFPSEEKISGMAPVEYKEMISHYDLSGDLSKNIKAAEKARAKETVDIKKAKNSARKEYMRIQGVIDRAENTGGFSDEVIAMLPKRVQVRYANADRSEYAELLKEYAQQLKDEHGFDVTPRKSKPPVTEAPQGAIDYLKKNPGSIDYFEKTYGYKPEGY